MRRVIISSCGPALKRIWQPITNEYDLVFLEETTTKWAKDQGWPVQYLAEYGVHESVDLLWQIIGKLLLQIDWQKAEQAFRWGNKHAQADRWLIGYVIRCYADIIPKVLALDNLLEQREVAGLILHEDVSNLFQYIAQWAKARGVPSVHVAHGPYGSVEPQSYEPYDVHSYLSCDHLCVFNEGQRQLYLRNGAMPEQVHLTGAPEMDKWHFTPDREHAKEMFGLDKNRPVVMYIGDWANQLHGGDSLDVVDRGFAEFLEGVKLLPDWQVLVKVHPGTHKWDTKWHADMMKERGVHGVVTLPHLELSVQAADVMYTPRESTVCWEGAIIDRPSVRPILEEIGAVDSDFYMYCIGESPESVAEAIRKARGIELTDAWQAAKRRVVYDKLYLTDGRATERVVNKIREVFASADTAAD